MLFLGLTIMEVSLKNNCGSKNSNEDAILNVFRIIKI
jgi:hypothetical protein